MEDVSQHVPQGDVEQYLPGLPADPDGSCMLHCAGAQDDDRCFAAVLKGGRCQRRRTHGNFCKQHATAAGTKEKQDEVWTSWEDVLAETSRSSTSSSWPWLQSFLCGTMRTCRPEFKPVVAFWMLACNPWVCSVWTQLPMAPASSFRSPFLAAYLSTVMLLEHRSFPTCESFRRHGCQCWIGEPKPLRMSTQTLNLPSPLPLVQ